MTSKANIKKRGETYTFYVYVTDRDGRRRQVSRGGFKTIREAQEARVTALHGIQTGTFVRPERVTVREFLEADLVDTMHVAVAPIELGRGERLWNTPEDLLDRFHLEAITSPSSGVVHHVFWRR